MVKFKIQDCCLSPFPLQIYPEICVCGGGGVLWILFFIGLFSLRKFLYLLSTKLE